MKFTLRMKKAILQLFIINMIFFVVFVSLMIFYSYPKITAYEAQKQDLQSILQETNKVQQEGISFADFRSESQADDTLDKYSKYILGDINTSMYTELAINKTKDKSFDEFTQAKKLELTEILESSEYTNREASIENILPVFSKGGDSGISRLDFVNYLEQLFYVFNVSYDGDIGFEELEEYKSDDEQDGTTQDKQEAIYYIPMSFNLIGKKKDIFDLIHFFENVGAINYSNGVLEVHQDDRIAKYIPSLRAQGITNIYNSQLAEISHIGFSEYPDSSTFSSSTEEGLLELIYNSQGYERYAISLEVRFYLAGIPEFNMTEKIETFIQKYNDLNTAVSQSYARYNAQKHNYTSGEQIQALESLRKMSLFFTSMSKDYTSFLKSYRQSTNLELSYTLASEYLVQLEGIQKHYDQIIKLLDTNN